MAEQSLKEKTAKGLLWGGLNNGVQQLLNILFGIFLARILTAEDYGMVGMLSVFSLIAGSLQESGFTAALANKRDINDKDYNAVFWFSIIVSSTLYIILFLCAPLIADFFNTPQLTWLSRYVFLGFLIASVGTAYNAYFFRNLQVKQKAIATITALSVSGCTGIILALSGFAYWGIATQSLLYILIIDIFYIKLSKWHPTLNIDLSPLKGMTSFSCKLLITNIFNHINNNLFSVALGKLYSGQEVGYFSQANKWNVMGHSLVSGMINSIAQPVLASVSDDTERQQRIFRKMLRFTAFISFPTMFGLSLIAPEFIVIAITDKWLPSALMLQILCIGGAFMPIMTLYTNLIISKGKSNIYMWNIICLCVTQILSVLCLHSFGIKIMIIGFISINIGWLIIWHHFAKKEINLSLFKAIKDIMPYLLISACTMIATYVITMNIANIYLLLASKIIIAAFIYLSIMKLSNSIIFNECVAYFINKIRREND